MIDKQKLKEAVFTLKQAGIEITSFHARPEVIAELLSDGIVFHSVVTGNAKWMEHAPDDGIGRGVGSRHSITLFDIPLEQRV
jgi:NAD(P)H-dependent flavin oxidoreductase YrpB (nitropropane dioxygenase family)